jgi:hypothetical protein
LQVWGIDEDIWKATRVDGIPKWRTYYLLVLPMLTGALGTCLVLLSISVVKVYDLVVAMTNGGPGFASGMPAKFVMDNLFERQNAGQASAGVVIMLLTVVIVFAPVISARSMKNASKECGEVTAVNTSFFDRTMADTSAHSGAKPRHLTLGRVGLYCFLLVALAFLCCRYSSC